MIHLQAAHIRAWLAGTFGLDAEKLGNDSSIFQSGLLDSFNLLELVAHVENATGKRVRSIDINLENFDSIAKIISYIDRAQTRVGKTQS